jgi:hypothetical protein
VALQPQGRFRRFLPTPAGRILIVALAIVAVFATYAYIPAILAIPTILLFGLALPIWGGLKRPRFLAVIGLVVVVAVAPIATVVFTQELFVPVGTVDSATDLSDSNGNAVMQNATLQPYSGSTSTVFNWTVTVFPGNVPKGNETPYELDLYISTCPGATGNNSPDCSQPYPFHVLYDRTLPGANETPTAGAAPYQVNFSYTVGSNGIWAWQMGLYTLNSSTKNQSWFQELVGDPTYDGIEGPIVGGFATIYLELLPTIYFQDLLFLGAPFFFVLLIYMLFKNRERRKKEAQQRAPGPLPPKDATSGTAPPVAKGTPLPSSKTPPSSSAGPSAASTAAVQEFNCPKCNAVVYAGEKTCWKCGETLPSPAPPVAKSVG